MRNTLLFPSLVLSSLITLSADTAFGQTYYYVDGISVSPPSPTTFDNITITLSGNLSSSGAYIVSASHMVMDNTVHITVVAADPGGLAVLVPHDEAIQSGTLPVGIYTIVIDGNAVLDMAPPPQHQFEVSSAGTPCDDLQIASVHWHAFSDTAIVVHAINNSVDLFDYPNFILLDTNGDTLAKETVNFFGIGGDSWHVLRIMDGAVVPTEPFYGTLELWTGFTTSLACSWWRFIDLCPPGPCAILIPTVQNFGGALTIGTYDWSIYDEDFTLMGSGMFTMVDTIQFDSDTLCVPPGHYFMACDPNDPPTGGQPYFGVQVDGWINGPSTPLVWSLPVLLEFDFYAPCGEGTNGVADLVPAQGLNVVQENGGITLRCLYGSELGPIDMFDVQGRLLYQASSFSNIAVIPLRNVTSGIVIIHAAGMVTKAMVLAY